MVRLIDADALKEAFGECPYNWTDSPEEIQAVCDWDSAVDTIDNAPTIEAIPIDWLKQKAIGFDDPFNCFMRVMFAWFKEQREGSNG